MTWYKTSRKYKQNPKFADLCPVCNHLMKTYDDYLDHLLMESSKVCPRCKYYDEYMAGYTQVGIKRHRIIYDYRDSFNTIKKLNRKLNKVIRFKRKQFREMK